MTFFTFEGKKFFDDGTICEGEFENGKLSS
jgi:hypothetical protein